VGFEETFRKYTSDPQIREKAKGSLHGDGCAAHAGSGWVLHLSRNGGGYLGPRRSRTHCNRERDEKQPEAPQPPTNRFTNALFVHTCLSGIHEAWSALRAKILF
jgi:hypothetical protein